MNKIKDFIYDKSDIVVAILILFIAAVIILWRFNVILDYPKTLIANQNIVQTEGQTGGESTEQGEEGTLTPEDVVPVEDEQTVQEEQTQQTAEAETQSQEQTQQPNVSLWVDGKLTATVTVEVKGASATAAVQCLIDKGLYKDYEEYKTYCNKLGLDDEKVAADTFKFKEGTTKDEITKRINWGKSEE